MKKILPYLQRLLSCLKKAPELFKKLLAQLKKLKPYFEKMRPFFDKIGDFLKKGWYKIRPYVQKVLAYLIKICDKLRPYWVKAIAWLKAEWKIIRPYVIKGLPYALVSLVSIAITLSITIALMPTPRMPTKLDTLEQLIENYFIGEKDQTAMEDAAANAMVNALGDRWSYYLPAEYYDAYTETVKNVYVGIGTTLSSMREDGIGLDVIDVKAEGPASEAGVQAGDIIIGIDGTELAGVDVDTIKQMLQGEAETKMKLKLLRGETVLELEVTRKEIRKPVATGQMLDGQVGLVTIVNFNDNCASEAIAAIEKLITDGAQALIFDVRNNPGGHASEMVGVLDRLLPAGAKLFTAVDYTGKETTEVSDETCLDVPMAVVVNGESYSAAEYFAAALNENDAAIVVGEKTSGKGYFQNAFKLSDNSMVLLSVGKYYTPNGISLTDVGITPQVIVPVTEKIASQIQEGTLVPMQDPQILAAIEALQ